MAIGQLKSWDDVLDDMIKLGKEADALNLAIDIYHGIFFIYLLIIHYFTEFFIVIWWIGNALEFYNIPMDINERKNKM